MSSFGRNLTGRFLGVEPEQLPFGAQIVFAAHAGTTAHAHQGLAEIVAGPETEPVSRDV
jgi:hypothetical protein